MVQFRLSRSELNRTAPVRANSSQSKGRPVRRASVTRPYFPPARSLHRQPDLRRAARSHPLLSMARVTLLNGELPALTASCAFGGLHRAAVRANAVCVSTSHGPISLSSKDDHDDRYLHRVEPFAPRFHNRRTYQLKRRPTSSVQSC
jgi:hypothetical protein